MNICVIGAGPGALALAGHLGLTGYRVGLYELPRFSQNIVDVKQTGWIRLNGLLSGRIRLELITTDIGEAAGWADILILVTHAAAHDEVARSLAPYLTAKHAVILFPGYVGGAWCFNRIARNLNSLPISGAVECSVLPYACRKPEADSVTIHGLKRKFMVSVTGGEAAEKAVSLLRKIFDAVLLSRHPLEAGLNETNFIIHAGIALINIGFVQGNAPWTFYRQGLTEGCGRLIETLDTERLNLMSWLGLNPIPLSRWMLDFYGGQGMAGGNIRELLGSFPPFESSIGPLSFDHRYFSEDIGYGLVPMASLAAVCNVDAPVTNAMIELACSLTGKNYRLIGRDLSDFCSRGSAS